MLKMKKISETYDMKVFTDNGEYFGDVEESILTQNKVFGWRVRATKNSFLNKVLGSAKGVIVPHQLVKSIGDIVIISKAAVPSYSEGSESKEKDEPDPEISLSLLSVATPELFNKRYVALILVLSISAPPDVFFLASPRARLTFTC